MQQLDHSRSPDTSKPHLAFLPPASHTPLASSSASLGLRRALAFFGVVATSVIAISLTVFMQKRLGIASLWIVIFQLIPHEVSIRLATLPLIWFVFTRS